MNERGRLQQLKQINYVRASLTAKQDQRRLRSWLPACVTNQQPADRSTRIISAAIA